jgi:hypothetical protein
MRTLIRAYYTFHYSEPDGLDCGFHCEPNPRVDGNDSYVLRLTEVGSNKKDMINHQPSAGESQLTALSSNFRPQ